MLRSEDPQLVICEIDADTAENGPSRSIPTCWQGKAYSVLWRQYTENPLQPQTEMTLNCTRKHINTA